MRPSDAHKISATDVSCQHCSWDGDNRKEVVEHLMKLVPLSPDVRQVVRWAYGYDNSVASFEGISDGSTVVADLYMGGIIKEPYGVGHDMIFILHHIGLPDPSGHYWSWWESNRWYKKGMSEFCPTFETRASIRWFGLTAGSWVVWHCPINKTSRRLRKMRKLPDDEKKRVLADICNKSFRP